MANSQRILPYLDMPLQHINDVMLRRMARRVTREETERLLERLRSHIPGLVLRTTLITGFPGETAEHFAELLEFVRRQRFERLGVFEYSLEADTPAAALPDHVDPATRRQRREQLMLAQQRIAFDWNQQQIGKTLEVILDSAVPGEPQAWVGRSYADAPDVDGLVYVTGDDLSAGQIVGCEVVATQDYDLVAVALGAQDCLVTPGSQQERR